MTTVSFGHSNLTSYTHALRTYETRRIYGWRQRRRRATVGSYRLFHTHSLTISRRPTPTSAHYDEKRRASSPLSGYYTIRLKRDVYPAQNNGRAYPTSRGSWQVVDSASTWCRYGVTDCIRAPPRFYYRGKRAVHRWLLWRRSVTAARRRLLAETCTTCVTFSIYSMAFIFT